MSSSELFKSKGFSKLLDADGEWASDKALVSVFNVIRSVSMIIGSWLEVRLFFELIVIVIIF